jgi:lipoate-protein ligase A
MALEPETGETDIAWRCLPFSTAPAPVQLAAAEALLAGLNTHQRPVMRWYTASAPALVLGTGQRPDAADLAACTQAGVTLHRRSSGGTAVLLAPGFLMLDIALPRAHRLHLGDVTESYRWLGAVWVATLDLLGLPARHIPIPEARADLQALDQTTRLACFGGRSPYEVLVGARKLVGLSQIRRRYGALLQAGIYRSWSPGDLAKLLALPAAAQALLTEQLTARVAGLEELLPTPPDAPTIMAAFAHALHEREGVVLEHAAWSADELAAREQAQARYVPITP